MASDLSQRATVKWRRISKEVKLNENIIRRNRLNVYYPFIFQFQRVSVPFIREFLDIIREQSLWDVISKYQKLDLDFILEFREDLNWDLVLQYQDLTDSYSAREQAAIRNVTGTSTFEFFIRKSDINLTLEELSSLTSFDIQSSTTATNNKSYDISLVSENDDSFIIQTTDSFTTGSVREGWIFLNDSGSGENTTTFLENSDIQPFLHRDNNLNRPYRDSLSKGQALSETFIINNILDLNISLVCQYQKLNDFFVLRRSTDSIFPDAEANIDFDWDQMVINQDFSEVWEDPDYNAWVRPKVNKQLLLRYQNISRDFIFDNIADLQLPDVGRFNRNLSTADLQQIEEDNPFLTETTDRPGSVKFNYNFGEIRQDLINAGFEFEGANPVGYVFYHRNGKTPYNSDIRFNQPSGTTLSVSQVDLDEDTDNSRSGIAVQNGNQLVNFEDRQAFNIAKVKVDIVPRDIDHNAKGSISLASKSNYINTDRLVIPDGLVKRTFEFDINGTQSQINTVCYNQYTFSISNEIVTTNVNHRLEPGDPVTVSGTLPTPLLPNTTYYAMPIGLTTLRLALSPQNVVNNIPINIVDGSGNMSRDDNKLVTTDDINLYSSLPIHFRGTGTNPNPIISTNTYFAIKEGTYTFRVATSEDKARNGSFVTLTSFTTDKVVTAETIPVDLRSSDIIRSGEMATIFNRVITNLYELEVSGGDTNLFSVDPWYPRLKKGILEDISEWIDYSSEFSADAGNNRFTLNAEIPINNGDPISLDGSPPSPLNTSSVYYAIKISNTEFEIALTPENAEDRISVNLQSNGSGTIFPLRVDLTTDIDINTGNKVEVSSSTLPTGLSSSTVYYVRKINSKRIEFCASLDDAFNGVPIAIRRSGSDSKNLTANDWNVQSGSSFGVNHFKSNNKIYVEFFDSIPESGDIINIRGSGTSFNIDSISPILELEGDVLSETINLESTLPSNQKSLANNNIERFTKNLNSIRLEGMSGGFEDTIQNQNARGVGVVFSNGNLRAFSVTILDNDWYDNLRF